MHSSKLLEGPDVSCSKVGDQSGKKLLDVSYVPLSCTGL